MTRFRFKRPQVQYWPPEALRMNQILAAFWLSLLFILIYSGFPSAAQQQAPLMTRSLGTGKSSNQIQFRDTAELHVRGNVSLTVTDLKGKVRQHDQGSLNLLYQGCKSAQAIRDCWRRWRLFMRLLFIAFLPAESGSMAQNDKAGRYFSATR